MHVVATAGHVDHGKSTLVRALTGMEPDRWAEERRRGMTIDLGYAWTKLADGADIAFVDVPGHERFIANMLAGIGPVPAVMLVIAADEGWCRQTGEHVAALDALDVRHGVLAISRSDLGDADLAIEEARDYLAGTSLEGIEAVAVSGLTGAGLDELRSALATMVGRLPAPDPDNARLWIDRVFTVRGSGTVVTGTISSGSISIDDDLRLAPTGELVRIRGLQTLKTSTDHASAVARVAVNLRGVKPEDVSRGCALVAPSWWADTNCVDVRLVRAPERLSSELLLHVGSAAVPVRVRRFDPDHARLTLSGALPLHIGERGLLRDPGPQRIVAGLIVLDTMTEPLRRRGAAAARLAQLAEITDERDLSADIRRRQVVARSRLITAGLLGWNEPLPADAVGVGDWVVHRDHWEQWKRSLVDVVAEWTTAHPMALGMPRAAAARALGLPDPRLLEQLVAEVDPLTSDAAGVHSELAARAFPADVQRGLDIVLARLAASQFDAPSVPELEDAGLNQRHLSAAAKAGLLVRISEGIYLRPEAIAEAAERLARLDQPFTVSQARDELGGSRRIVLPLLELLDRRAITERLDDSQRRVKHRER